MTEFSAPHEVTPAADPFEHVAGGGHQGARGGLGPTGERRAELSPDLSFRAGAAGGSDVGDGRVAQRAGRAGDVGEGGGDHEVAAPGQHPAVAGEVPAGYVDGNLVAVSVAAAVDRDRTHTVGLVSGRAWSSVSHVGTSDRGPAESVSGPAGTGQAASMAFAALACKGRCTCSGARGCSAIRRAARRGGW